MYGKVWKEYFKGYIFFYEGAMQVGLMGHDSYYILHKMFIGRTKDKKYV
jgi:hypothetical protein